MEILHTGFNLNNPGIAFVCEAHGGGPPSAWEHEFGEWRQAMQNQQPSGSSRDGEGASDWPIDWRLSTGGHRTGDSSSDDGVSVDSRNGVRVCVYYRFSIRRRHVGQTTFPSASGNAIMPRLINPST